MKDDEVLRVNSLGKCFKIYPSPWYRAKEWLTAGRRTYHQSFWALRDISFTVKRGEFFGIIGQNGAGKSTLLKVLSGVLQPTTGSYDVQGRVLSMLELGLDFNPFLSGRENAIRTAELLRFPAGYVQERLEHIADFSELGEFFDRPVRLYSKGMGSRLAFSLFAFLECDILILDEVLAVGDIFFKQKCYARLEELIAKGTTILLVTHSMTVVRQFCKNLIVLNKGLQLYQGEPIEGIQMYSQIKERKIASLALAIPQDEMFTQNSYTSHNFVWPSDDVFMPVHYPETDQAKLTRFITCNKMGKPCLEFMQGEQAYFYCEFQLKQYIEVPIIRLMISNQFNVLVHAKNSLQHEINLPKRVKRGDYIRFCRKITLNVAPDEYVFGLVLKTMTVKDYVHLSNTESEVFLQKKIHLWRYDHMGSFRIMPIHGKGGRNLHGGICDLPGECYIQLISNT